MWLLVVAGAKAGVQDLTHAQVSAFLRAGKGRADAGQGEK